MNFKRTDGRRLLCAANTGRVAVLMVVKDGTDEDEDEDEDGKERYR